MKGDAKNSINNDLGLIFTIIDTFFELFIIATHYFRKGFIFNATIPREKIFLTTAGMRNFVHGIMMNRLMTLPLP